MDSAMHVEPPEETVTDELTGLYNRDHFSRRLSEELKRVESSKNHLSLFIVDIDRFKDVNDAHGHTAGDETLSKIAHLIRSNLKSSDDVFRYAGDQFAVILLDTDSPTALKVAQRVADRVSGQVLDILGKPVRVTVSVGVATFPEDGQNLVSLSEFAEKALYARKKRGGNGVCGKSEVTEDAVM